MMYIMGQENNLLKIGGGLELENGLATVAKDSGINAERESEHCTRCLLLGEKYKKAEERCVVLESEFEKKRSAIELLGSKLILLEVEKCVLESLGETNNGFEKRITRTVNANEATADEGKGEKGVIDLTEDMREDRVLELMIENKVLECEKKKAESEVEFWKAKCNELEFQVTSLVNNLSPSFREHLSTGITSAGSVFPGSSNKKINETQILQDECFDGATPPLLDTSHGYVRRVKILHERGQEYVSQVKKQLNFGEGTPDKITPATPAGCKPAPAGLINISDSDDEASALSQHALHQSSKTYVSADLEGGVASCKKELSASSDIMGFIGKTEIEDALPHCYRSAPHSLATKRKRTSHIVQSDSGSDADDNVPLCRLRKSYSNGANMPPVKKNNFRDAGCSVKRKGIMQHSRVNLKKSESKNNCSIPTTGSFTDDETEEGDSDSEGESLKSFIVSGSESDFSAVDESSEGDENSNTNERSATESEDESEGNVDYHDVISRIARRKDHVVRWEFEADMLAAFGKDPELCMKAVCALYRQQTSDEKMSKVTKHLNQRGFSQCDATRGSILGEFLTDGDPEGGLKKSVEELLEFDSKGVELCRTLANHYSKQLFAMYGNKEDSLWPALETKS